MALTKDVTRVYELGEINEFLVLGAKTIYQGGAIGLNPAGYAKAIAVGDLFVGFAEDFVDNSTGLDGANRIRVRQKGAILLEIANITLADVKKPVYATDDNTFTLVPTNAVYVGRIARIESANVALVEFNANAVAVS